MTDFDDRVRKLVSDVDGDGKESSTIRDAVINVLSSIVGYLFIGLTYGVGAFFVANGFGISLSFINLFSVGIGLSTIHLAFRMVGLHRNG